MPRHLNQGPSDQIFSLTRLLSPLLFHYTGVQFARTTLFGVTTRTHAHVLPPVCDMYVYYHEFIKKNIKKNYITKEYCNL
jgi:hypothetical protein